ncbi:hypothetical protein F511_15543 [Dorcoceras hygrometricum]|uniref:Uncharacterized protein n=1 Tax=Dorcoceras hygrometricum TaxID=472368 RepID=A0A2Z7BY33_9LAMI|nr:hypothetical protein F511_15543 [Dorcoceras hygrometricum]
MASSLFSNIVHVFFDSVLAMDNPGMVLMFEALMASGLKGFIGCAAVLYKAALVEFFENTSVRDGVVISTVGGKQKREKIIDEVEQFFNSYSFRRMAALNLTEFYAKVEMVLSWAGGSLNFCRTIAVVEPVSVFGSRRPTVTLWGWSQLCTAFVRCSLFSGLSTVDIRYFVSTLALNRSVLRDVQLVTHSVSVAPSAQISIASVVNQFVQIATSSVLEDQNAQMALNQRPHSPTTSDDSSMRFDDDETASTPISLPDIPTDLQASFTQLRASIEQLQFEHLRRKDDNEKRKDILLMHIRDLEKHVNARFDEHDRVYRALLTNICKYMHDHKTVLSLDIVRSHQKLSTQVAAAALDNVDVRKEVKEQRAMITDLDGQVATVRSELLDFRVKAEENHLNLSTQLGFLVDYINRGGDAKKGEGGRSIRPQPPPDDQSRPSGGSARREGGNSRGIGSESCSGSKRRRGSGGGSRDRQHSSGSGYDSGRVTYGPYLPPKRSAKYWVYGEKEF